MSARRVPLPAHRRKAQLPQARVVLEFWLRDALELGWPSQSLSALWWGGGAELDRDIEGRFGHLVHEAVAGGLTDWEATPLDRLALVVLLDQFTRNVFRGRHQAFAGDGRAQALATDALALAWDEKLPLAGRVFLVTPLEHAESLALQEECVRRFKSLLEGAAAERAQDIQEFLKSAQQHRDIIATFGRFPHRNQALGRASSAAEQEFLQHGPRFGQ